MVVIGHALGFVGDDQAGDQAGVLGGDADRAVVGIAFEGLDTAEGHHHGPGGIAGVGTEGQAFDQVEGRGDFARSIQLNLGENDLSIDMVALHENDFEYPHIGGFANWYKIREMAVRVITDT